MKNKYTTVQVDQKTHKELIKIKAKLEAEIGENLNMNRVIFKIAVEANKDFKEKKDQLKLGI